MISDVKHIKSKGGAHLDIIEVTPDDKKTGIRITVMKNSYGISVAPAVHYYSKQKETWIEQKEFFRVDQWNTMVALQGAIQQAVDILGGDTRPAYKPEPRDPNAVFNMPESRIDDDDIPF